MLVFRCTRVALLVAGAWCASSALIRADQAPSLNDLAVPVMPARKGEAPAPRLLPVLPAGADRVTPLTLHVRVTTRAAGHVTERRQTVTRTADRLHIVGGAAAGSAVGGVPGGVEWLFERNPVDPRRASATYVAHAAKTIVVYSDSDLQTMLGIPGWAHILMMGIDPESLRGTTPSSDVRAIDGLRFARLTGGAAPPSAPLWWNADQLLPAEVSSGDTNGSTRRSIDRVSNTVDLQLVRPADLRFPGYRVVNLADWLEEH